MYHFWYVRVIFSLEYYFLPLQSDWSLSCDHGLDYASSFETNTRLDCVRGWEVNVYTSIFCRRLRVCFFFFFFFFEGQCSIFLLLSESPPPPD